MKPLKRLSDNHRAAIRMKIEGHSGRDIAETLDVELRTVYLWFSDPLVKAELGAQRGYIAELFANRIAEVGMQALRRLEQLADMSLEEERVTVNQKLEILREIRNWVPGLNTGGSGTTEPVGPPEDMEDHELIDRLRHVMAQLPEGVVTDADVVENGASAHT